MVLITFAGITCIIMMINPLANIYNIYARMVCRRMIVGVYCYSALVHMIPLFKANKILFITNIMLMGTMDTDPH